MKKQDKSRFVYVAYIRTTPAKLWEALTGKQLKYWFYMTVECDWTVGSPWKMSYPDGTQTDMGEILEVDPLRRLVIRWQNEWKPELKAEGFSRCTIELEPVESAIKLTLTHEMDRPESKFIAAVAVGWPLVISNLKSLLETGKVAVVNRPGH